ncbi:MAG: hypothetical protein WCE30_25250 [Mycobacterium sp.]
MGTLTEAVIAQGTQHQSVLVKAFGLVGITAGVALGALSIASTPAPTTAPNASSGDAPTNTVYVSPSVGGMTVGATQTWTPAGTAENTMQAVPPVKAPPYGQ